MKYITFDGDETRAYKRDYNTNNFTERDLKAICEEWTNADDDGTEYYLAED